MGDWGLLLTPQPTLRVQTDVECIAGSGLKWQHTTKLLLAPLLHPRAESWVKNVGGKGDGARPREAGFF